MALSANSRLAEMTNAIIQATMSGRIAWEKTSLNGIYATSIGSYIVHIEEQIRRGASMPDYFITLYDRGGEVVDRYCDPDLASETAIGYDGFFNAMSALYRSAAQQASGTNEAIDEILRALQK